MQTTNWNDKQRLYAISTFGEHYHLWKEMDCTDIRKRFCDDYEHIFEALHTLPENPHYIVRNAMNAYLQRSYYDPMESLLKEFENK